MITLIFEVQFPFSSPLFHAIFPQIGAFPFKKGLFYGKRGAYRPHASVQAEGFVPHTGAIPKGTFSISHLEAF